METSLLEELQKFITKVSESLPVEIFVFLGSIIEDILTPIPSPLILSTAGSLLQVQNANIFQIVFVIFLATVAKTLMAYLFYRLGDIAEDIIIPRFGKYIGLSHKQIESMGKMFNGGARDEFILFVLRALPVTPTSLVSILAGIIKIPMKTFIRATFFGFFIRNAFYIAVGYYGTETVAFLLPYISSIESLMKAGIVGVVLLFIAYMVYQKYKDRIQEWIEKRLEQKK